MIDTTEIGGGSYPEPPEPKEKCYWFKFNATTKGAGYVYAENYERAEELINSGEYEVDYTYDMEIEEITKFEEGE